MAYGIAVRGFKMRDDGYWEFAFLLVRDSDTDLSLQSMQRIYLPIISHCIE
jgi:hypothetical protein